MTEDLIEKVSFINSFHHLILFIILESLTSCLTRRNCIKRFRLSCLTGLSLLDIVTENIGDYSIILFGSWRDWSDRRKFHGKIRIQHRRIHIVPVHIVSRTVVTRCTKFKWSFTRLILFDDSWHDWAGSCHTFTCLPITSLRFTLLSTRILERDTSSFRRWLKRWNFWDNYFRLSIILEVALLPLRSLYFSLLNKLIEILDWLSFLTNSIQMIYTECLITIEYLIYIMHNPRVRYIWNRRITHSFWSIKWWT